MVLRKPLSRRTVLKGIVGGTAVSIALPALDIFLNEHGTAHADGSAFPRRFVLWFWGNGVQPDRWVPSATGPDWIPSEQLMPLSDVKDRVTVVSGLRVHAGNDRAHESGPAGFLTGAPLLIAGGRETIQLPSIDQVLAAEIGGETRFRSLELGVGPHTSGRSYNGADSRVPVESSPRAAFDRIFGMGFTAPGEDPMPDPEVAIRRSILDAIGNDSQALMSRVGARDRIRLEQHFDSIRELELRLARLEDDPPALEACAAPEPPAEDYPDVEGRPPLLERNAAMTEVLAMAMACDQTRVASYWFSDPQANYLFPGAEAGHHQLTHDEPGEQPQVNSIVQHIMENYAVTIDRLSSITEGDGTLLDNSLVLATTDVSHGQRHSLDDFPILLSGTACGRIQQGVHYRSNTDENTSNLALTILQAMGAQQESFGLEEGESSETLTSVEIT